MRILLTANASHVPPRGGATRSNLVWVDALAAAAHECRIVGAALEAGDTRQQIEQEQIDAVPIAAEVLQRGPVRVWSVADPARRATVLSEQVREFRPDWVLVSSEDVGHALLQTAHREAPGRVVYLAHTPQFFPFGPASWNPDAEAAALVRRSAAVVVIGRHMAGYVRQHLGRDAAVVHPPIYGSGPFPRRASFDRGLITMVNPCAVKGLPIFLALAGRFPEHEFAALPGWGTTAPDRAALERLANVRLLPNAKDIDTVLAQTRVLVVPSLWYEGFGLIVMEAMLRGVPVVASNSGGLQEAKAGTGFVIPVPAVERYTADFDERGMPRPVVPPIDIEPWIAALDRLLTDRDAYEAESRASRQVAHRFVETLDPGAMEKLLRGLRAAPMRILLAHNSTYWPAHGGGDKSNRLLMEELAARGHACRVVARTAGFGAAEEQRYLADLARRGVSAGADQGVVSFTLHGVEVHTAANHPNLRGYFARQIGAFAPDVILTSTDDPAQLLLQTALEAGNARVVYLARATLAVPFGPDCAFPSEQKTGVLRQVDGAVGVSQYVADYLRRWGGLQDAVHVPISLLDRGPWPGLGRVDNEFVTLVNPCAVKGVSIFLELARAMPEVSFAAVPTWGTNADDRAALAAHANVTLLDPVDDIDLLLARTRVLLVPSLWAEARSRIVVEAMLRGVPVLAADVGGIPEAKLGVPYLLPVRPIAKYRTTVDEQMVPVAEVPPQEIGTWRDALARLLSDPEHYERISRASRDAAMAYAGGLSVVPFEMLLQDVLRRQRRARATAARPAVPQSALERLSPEKRHLLALRLRKRAAWFPSARDAPLRLFCFPHAGGGAAAFARWKDRLPACVAVCPARLPGRESRFQETPFCDMSALVAALADAIEPLLDRPFAFYGHSMGAAVAFELARHLRGRGRPLPRVLLVTGARAPQFRLHWTPPPEPAEADFIRELEDLDGLPAEVLRNQELLQLVLPAMRADAALYRNYVYRPEEPLACAIRAWGGSQDPNVRREHVEAWCEQTSVSFAARFLPGGHFFVQAQQAEFLDQLGRELSAAMAVEP